MGTDKDLSLALNTEESSEYSSEEESDSYELPMKSPVAALVLGSRSGQSYDDESNIHDDIILTLEFPDGKKKDVKCKTGETVINLKKKLFDEFEIPFSCKLSFGDKQMLDPLSLNDFPDLISASKKNEKTLLKISL